MGDILRRSGVEIKGMPKVMLDVRFREEVVKQLRKASSCLSETGIPRRTVRGERVENQSVCLCGPWQFVFVVKLSLEPV